SLGKDVEQALANLGLSVLFLGLVALAASIAVPLPAIAVPAGVAAVVVVIVLVVGIVRLPAAAVVGVVGFGGVLLVGGLLAVLVGLLLGPVLLAAVFAFCLVGVARRGSRQIQVDGRSGFAVGISLHVHDPGDEPRLLQSIGFDSHRGCDFAQFTDGLLLQLSSRGHVNPQVAYPNHVNDVPGPAQQRAGWVWIWRGTPRREPDDTPTRLRLQRPRSLHVPEPQPEPFKGSLSAVVGGKWYVVGPVSRQRSTSASRVRRWWVVGGEW